jgi:hypothetical protein
MSAISGPIDTPLPSAALAPEQQVEQAVLGGGSGPTTGTSGPDQGLDAALVGLSGAAVAGSGGAGQASVQIPSPSLASQLVSAMAAEISAAGPSAASVYSLLSAGETYLLTRA